MKMWWMVWRGHVFAAVAILFGIATVYWLWLAIRSSGVDSIFTRGMLSLFCGILTLCIGAVAVYYWNTPRERRGVRNGTLIVRGKRHKAPGRDK